MRKIISKQTIITLSSVLSLLILIPSAVYAADDSAAFKKEIEELRNKVADLEQKLNQQNQPGQSTQQNLPARNKQSNVYPVRPVSFQEEWDPFAEMEQMQQQMNRMFNNSFWRGQGGSNYLGQLNHFDPTADVQETKDGYVVKLDIPGMEKGDINVEVKNSQLIISGEKKSDKVENNQNTFYRRERSFGSFSRVVPLPEDANPEKVSADYVNGILTVKVDKLDKAKNNQSVKKVEIK